MNFFRAPKFLLCLFAVSSILILDQNSYGARGRGEKRKCEAADVIGRRTRSCTASTALRDLGEPAQKQAEADSNEVVDIAIRPLAQERAFLQQNKADEGLSAQLAKWTEKLTYADEVWQAWLTIAKDPQTDPNSTPETEAEYSNFSWIAVRVSKEPYRSQFALEESLYGLFGLEGNGTHYFIRFLEWNSGSDPDETVLVELRVDAGGEIAELVHLSKGVSISGSEMFRLAQETWEFLGIKRVVLMDAAHIDVKLDHEKTLEIPMRVINGIVEGQTWYQKIGGFSPMNFRSLLAVEGTLPVGTTHFFGQKEIRFQDAVSYLRALKVSELSLILEKSIQFSNKQQILTRLAKRFKLTGPGTTFQELVKKMSAALRLRKTKTNIADFQDLLRLLDPEVSQRRFGKEYLKFNSALIVLQGYYLWILEPSKVIISNKE